MYFTFVNSSSVIDLVTLVIYGYAMYENSSAFLLAFAKQTHIRRRLEISTKKSCDQIRAERGVVLERSHGSKKSWHYFHTKY